MAQTRGKSLKLSRTIEQTVRQKCVGQATFERHLILVDSWFSQFSQSSGAIIAWKV